MPYTAPAAPEAGLRLRSRRVRGNRSRGSSVWFVVTLLAVLAVMLALVVAVIAAASGATWTLRGPGGFSVVVPGVPIR